MIALRISALLLLLFVQTVASLDVQYLYGDETHGDDCSGETQTVDNANSDYCIGTGNRLASCILISYEGSPVDTSSVYSTQNGNDCGVYLQNNIEDGEYYYATLTLTGYIWTQYYQPPGGDRRRSTIMESAKNNHPVVKGHVLAKHAGYTVGGRLYDVPEGYDFAKLKGLTDAVKETLLATGGYKVISENTKFTRIKLDL